MRSGGTPTRWASLSRAGLLVLMGRPAWPALPCLARHTGPAPPSAWAPTGFATTTFHVRGGRDLAFVAGSVTQHPVFRSIHIVRGSVLCVLGVVLVWVHLAVLHGGSCFGRECVVGFCGSKAAGYWRLGLHSLNAVIPLCRPLSWMTPSSSTPAPSFSESSQSSWSTRKSWRPPRCT